MESFDTITHTMSYTNGLTYKDISHSCKYTIDLNEYPAMYCDIQVEWDWHTTTNYTEALTTIQSTGLAIFNKRSRFIYWKQIFIKYSPQDRQNILPQTI